MADFAADVGFPAYKPLFPADAGIQ